MRKRDPAYEEAIKAAVRKAFEATELVRDAQHEEACRRLLKHLDDFEEGVRGVCDGAA